MTTGTMMFFGGIAGAVLLSVIALIMIPVTAKRRKRMLEKILTEGGDR
ncbi:MAG: hypothetical protein IK016_05375 [Lachnospiraceae bacterium]|nr:hypothetical protein [Lachnospiraceae bacterium]